MLSQDSRIASIRSAERVGHMSGNIQNQNIIQSNYVSESRSPKATEQTRIKENPQARIFKKVPPGESVKQVLDINFNREPKKLKYEKELIESEREPVKPSKAFIASYQNEFSDHGLNGSRLNGSTQLTDALPSMNAISAIGRNEDKTVVSSINEIHSLNVIQEQPQIIQPQENPNPELQHGRRKSLISNEVARIISEFRTKMGMQGPSLENVDPTLMINSRNDQENQKNVYQVVTSAEIRNNSIPCEQEFDTFNHKFKGPSRDLNVEKVHNGLIEYNQNISYDQNKERGFAPLNAQANISPKTKYNLSTEIRPDTQNFQAELQNRRISQQYQPTYQQNIQPHHPSTQLQYTPQTTVTRSSQQQAFSQSLPSQQSNSRINNQYSSNDPTYMYQAFPERQKLVATQIYNNSGQFNQSNPMIVDSYSKKAQLPQQGIHQSQSNQTFFRGSPDLRNPNLSRQVVGYNSNERSPKQQVYVFTDAPPSEDLRAYNSRVYNLSPPQTSNFCLFFFLIVRF